ncbi:hypothetical protein D3C84_1277090 [compost metagenome]
MQNQTKRINAMAWPRIVAFMFTAQYLLNFCGLGFSNYYYATANITYRPRPTAIIGIASTRPITIKN